MPNYHYAFDDLTIITICGLYEAGWTLRDISIEFNCDISHVWNVVPKPAYKFTDFEILVMRGLYEAGWTYWDISVELNCSLTQAWLVVKYRTRINASL